MCELVKCFNCNREDEPSEGMMPVDADTLFGELVNPDTEWYCFDCMEIGEQRRIGQ